MVVEHIFPVGAPSLQTVTQDAVVPRELIAVDVFKRHARELTMFHGKCM